VNIRLMAKISFTLARSSLHWDYFYFFATEQEAISRARSLDNGSGANT